MGFEYRKLIVYQRAVQYDEIAAVLLPILAKRDPNLADHGRRSGNSLLTNIAEGGASDQPKVKAYFYRIAKREAEELANIWEKALRRRWVPRRPAELAIAYLDEVVLMLASLIRKFDP